MIDTSLVQLAIIEAIDNKTEFTVINFIDGKIIVTIEGQQIVLNQLPKMQTTTVASYSLIKMTNWTKAVLVAENGIIEAWQCFCHNGLKFEAGSKEEAEHERARYYNL